MSIDDGESRTRFDELKPGDRIEVECTATDGGTRRVTRTYGTVVRTERRRHGLRPCRGAGDEDYTDVILLELCDGELMTVTMDKCTVLRRA